MKTLTVFLAVLFVAVPAAAQAEGGSALPEISVRLPEPLASCVRSCMSEGSSPRPADHASCGSVTDATARSRIEALATEVRSIRSTVSSHTSTIANHTRRIRELEGSVGLLGGRVSDLEGSVRELREQITALRGEIESLERRYHLLAEDYVDLQVQVGVLDERLRALSGEVSALADRVSALERALRPVRFGPLAGFMAVWSADRTSYTGFPLGGRLSLQLTDRDALFADGGVTLSGGDAPVGTFVRGAYARTLHPMWGLEVGASGYWLGLNDQIKARSTLVLGDVTVGFRPHRLVDISAGPMIGAEFDQGSPSVAGGFRTQFTLLFP